MNDGTTHWEGCEHEHHQCALEMLTSSQLALRHAMEDRTALRAERDALKAERDGYRAELASRWSCGHPRFVTALESHPECAVCYKAERDRLRAALVTREALDRAAKVALTALLAWKRMTTAEFHSGWEALNCDEEIDMLRAALAAGEKDAGEIPDGYKVDDPVDEASASITLTRDEALRLVEMGVRAGLHEPRIHPPLVSAIAARALAEWERAR